MKYIDNKWQEFDEMDRFKLTKIEGQVWLAIYQLMMNEECQRKYELTSYRKNVLLKVQYFNYFMMYLNPDLNLAIKS